MSLPAGLLIASAAAHAQSPPAQGPPATLGFAPPRAQAQPARYQLGVRTSVVNLNETFVAPPATFGSAGPVSASETARQATEPLPPERPEGVVTGSAGPVSASETGRQATPTSPGPVAASSVGRQALPDLPPPVASGEVVGQPLPPLSPSGAGPSGLPAPAPFAPSRAPGTELPSGSLVPVLPPSQPGAAIVRRDPRGTFPNLKPILPPAAPTPAPGPAPMPDADPDFDPQFPPKPAPNLALRITEVAQGSPAQRAGLELGDIIRRANGYKLESHEQLKWVIANSRGFVRLRIVNVRDGSHQVIDVPLQ